MERNKDLINVRAHNGLSTLSEKCKKISKVIVEVNKLTSFPLDAEELLRWSIDIERIYPDINLDALLFLMDCFKTDSIEWDKSKGIQNIFNGLNRIRLTNGVYSIRNHNW